VSDGGRPRIFLVDDHAMFRAGVRAELGAAVDVVGEADEAEQWYGRAILLSDELGMRPEAAYARRDLARLLRRAGRNEEAELQETSAQDLRRAMGLGGQARHEERTKALASRSDRQEQLTVN